MARYEVNLSVTLTLDAASFQDAADLATGIIGGTAGKPDTARMSEVSADTVTKARP